ADGQSLPALRFRLGIPATAVKFHPFTIQRPGPDHRGAVPRRHLRQPPPLFHGKAGARGFAVPRPPPLPPPLRPPPPPPAPPPPPRQPLRLLELAGVGVPL